MNTTPPSEVRLKKSIELQSYHTRWTPLIHNTHQYGYRHQHGGNCCTPSEWVAEPHQSGPIAPGPPTPQVRAAAAARTRITYILAGFTSPTATGTSTLAVGQAPTVPAAAPESPATTTPTSGEKMPPSESREWQDNDGQAFFTEAPKKRGKRTHGRLEPSRRTSKFWGLVVARTASNIL